MKKSLSVFLALLAIVSFAFASGADEKKPAGKIALTAWGGWPPGNPQASTFGADFETAIADFQKLYPNVTVTTERLPNDVYKQKLQTVIAGDAAPDVFFTWGGSYLQPFVEAGKILALDSYLDPVFKSKMIPGASDLASFNGKLYALALQGWAAYLYCNRDLFQQNGLQYPKTFDDLVSLVKTFKEKGMVPLAMGNMERWPIELFYEALVVKYAGHKLIQKQVMANKLDIANEPAYLKAAQDIKRLVDAGAFRRDVLSVSMFAEGFQDFKDGKSPMMFHGNWLAGPSEAASSKVNGKVDLVPFPMVNDKSARGSVTDTWGGASDSYAVSAQTKAPKEAVHLAELIVFQINKNGYLKGYLVPPVYKVDIAPEQVKSDLAKQMMKLVEGSTSFTMGWDFMLNQKNTQDYLDNITKLLGGAITPEQFVQTLPH